MSAAPRSTAATCARGRLEPDRDLVREAVGPRRATTRGSAGCGPAARLAAGPSARRCTGPCPAAVASRRPRRAPGRHDEQVVELVQEVGVGPAQVDGDGPRRRVGLDPAERSQRRGLQRAAPRIGRQVGQEVANALRHRQQALERRADVLGRDGRAVGEAEVRAQPEHVRPPVRARLGHVGGEVGHERRARRAAGPPVGDQAVVDERRRRERQGRLDHGQLGRHRDVAC